MQVPMMQVPWLLQATSIHWLVGTSHSAPFQPLWHRHRPFMYWPFPLQSTGQEAGETVQETWCESEPSVPQQPLPLSPLGLWLDQEPQVLCHNSHACPSVSHVLFHSRLNTCGAVDQGAGAGRAGSCLTLLFPTPLIFLVQHGGCQDP